MMDFDPFFLSKARNIRAKKSKFNGWDVDLTLKNTGLDKYLVIHSWQFLKLIFLNIAIKSQNLKLILNSKIHFK